MPTVLAHSGAEADKSSVVECMDWQSDGAMLATGSMDGWIQVWNKSGVSHLLLTALPVVFQLIPFTFSSSLHQSLPLPSGQTPGSHPHCTLAFILHRPALILSPSCFGLLSHNHHLRIIVQALGPVRFLCSIGGNDSVTPT